MYTTTPRVTLSLRQVPLHAALAQLYAGTPVRIEMAPGTPDPTDLWTRASLPECYASERRFLEERRPAR